MDACWEAPGRATTVQYCMLMSGGAGSPAESLMLSTRWPYTGTHHLSSLIYFPPVQLLSERFMCENAGRSERAGLAPLLSPLGGGSYARLPTPPQAQQDLLVLTMPAPQGSRVACWVPHFSAGIPSERCGFAPGMLPDHSLKSLALTGS